MTHTCTLCQTEVRVTVGGPGRWNICGLVCRHILRRLLPDPAEPRPETRRSRTW